MKKQLTWDSVSCGVRCGAAIFLAGIKNVHRLLECTYTMFSQSNCGWMVRRTVNVLTPFLVRKVANSTEEIVMCYPKLAVVEHHKLQTTVSGYKWLLER